MTFGSDESTIGRPGPSYAIDFFDGGRRFDNF
jgi:hypothetical protein